MPLCLFSESNITISLSSNSSEVLEGDPIHLTCLVQSTTGPLSVVWQWMDKQATGPIQEVASVDREGSVFQGPAYRERSSYGEVRVEKVRPDTFTLSLYNALPGDEGQYHCTATEWLRTGGDQDFNWEKIGEVSDSKIITVKTVGRLFYPAVLFCFLVSKACKQFDTQDVSNKSKRGTQFLIC